MRAGEKGRESSPVQPLQSNFPTCLMAAKHATTFGRGGREEASSLLPPHKDPLLLFSLNPFPLSPARKGREKRPSPVVASLPGWSSFLPSQDTVLKRRRVVGPYSMRSDPGGPTLPLRLSSKDLLGELFASLLGGKFFKNPFSPHFSTYKVHWRTNAGKVELAKNGKMFLSTLIPFLSHRKSC